MTYIAFNDEIESVNWNLSIVCQEYRSVTGQMVSTLLSGKF